MTGLHDGKDRHAFIQSLEEAMEQLITTSAPLLEKNTPDDFFVALDSTIIKCGLRFCGKQANAAEDPEVSKLKSLCLLLLARRRELRQSIVDCSTDELADVEARLAATSKACQTHNRKIGRAKQTALINELYEMW